MAWPVEAAPEYFPAAVEWFRSRLPITDEQYDALVAEERARAFTIAGVAELSVVQDVHDEIARAIASGEGIHDWSRRTKQRIKDRWANPSSTVLETVFRNATQTAYGTGRWYQQQDPEVTNVRPFMMFDAVLDSRTSPICQELGEPPIIRTHDDPFVAGHWPPLHHRCRSQWQSISRRRARALGGPTMDDPDVTVTDGFGKAPPLRGDGWQPKADDYDPDLFETYRQKQGAMRNEDT